MQVSVTVKLHNDGWIGDTEVTLTAEYDGNLTTVVQELAERAALEAQERERGKWWNS